MAFSKLGHAYFVLPTIPILLLKAFPTRIADKDIATALLYVE